MNPTEVDQTSPGTKKDNNQSDDSETLKKETSEEDREAGFTEGTARRLLFAAVEGGEQGDEDITSCRPIVRLFFHPTMGALIEGETMTVKKQREVLLGAVRSHRFHKGYARRLFSGLAAILLCVVDNDVYFPPEAFDMGNSQEERRKRKGAPDENPMELDAIVADENASDEDSTEVLRCMRSCTLILSSYLDGVLDRRVGANSSSRDIYVIEEAFNVAECLHSALFSLNSCGKEGLQVQASIVSLCEKWWHSCFVDRELLVTQLVPLLVAKALDEAMHAQKSNLMRLFTMRKALGLFDFEDESIAYLRSLLLRTVSSPLFIKNGEGRRLISYIFTLDKSLVSDLHSVIKVQIPGANKKFLMAYGEIYYRSWKDSEESTEARSSIEDSLQDLMYSLLHVSSPSMAKSIKVVLTEFFDAKKSPDVEKMVYQSLNPILWRALCAANPLVRVNAAAVLSETFPLKDPDEGQAHIDECVGKTVSALTSHLKDSDPRVRVAGSHAIGKILGGFWDAIPSNDIRILLSHVITRHSSDVSSAAVRAESISAVTLILENPHSHAVLRPLLPSLGNLIHDNAEKVRLASVRMLLQIKQIRGIKYYHVVPIDHLLARLEAEGEAQNSNGPVASSITKLMINSYFPQGDHITGGDQIRRTLGFLKNNKNAASVFYGNMPSHLSVNSVAKLTAMLLKVLSSSIETKEGHALSSDIGKKRRRSATEKSMERSCSESKDRTPNTLKTSLMASVAETICCLWQKVRKKRMVNRFFVFMKILA